MMGIALSSLDVPVCKNNNAITVLKEDEVELADQKLTACIRCGRCVESCPRHLMPTLLETWTKRKNAEELMKLGVMTCMECGTCAFRCPAGRPLVQAIRMGKAIVKGAKQ